MNVKATFNMLFKNIEQWTITTLVAIVIFMLLNSFNRLSIEALDYLLPIKNRELGFVEGLQHVTLFISCIVMLTATMQRASKRTVYILVTCLVFFVFLEEVDYFLHYIDLVFGRASSPIKTDGFRNLHNQFNGLRKAGYLMVIYSSVVLLIYKGNKLFNSRGSKLTIIFMFIFIQLIYPLLLWLFNVGEDERQVYSELRELCLYVTGLCVMVRATHNH